MQTETAAVVASSFFLSDRQCAGYLGVSLTCFRDRVRSGVVPKPVKIGARSLWPVRDLEAFAENLIAARDARG